MEKMRREAMEKSKKTPEQIAVFNIRTARIVRRNIPDAEITGLSLATSSPIFFEDCLKGLGDQVGLFGDFISGAELNAEQEEFLSSVISYVCENGDITKDIVVNEAPFDELLFAFNTCLTQVAKYVDNMHNVIIPQNTELLRQHNMSVFSGN